MTALPRSEAVTSVEVHGYNSASMAEGDASLVRAVLDGSPQAFTALVDRHSRACLRFASRMLGNLQDAEDVTQETFLRAYSALGRYDERTAFRTWLMSILVNRCRTALQTRKRREGAIVVDDAALAYAAGRGESADAELRDAIARALARLDPSQREAFLLKHVEELSYDEMSRMTGAGISALKMRVQRACEHLQALLEEDRR